MNSRKRTRRQTNIRKLDLNNYKKKDTIRQNNYEMDKNKRTSKQGHNVNN